MAAPNRILALDLGTQSVGLAEFRPGTGGGLVLTAHRSTELLADPAADATRVAQTKMAVGEMVSAMGFKGQKVNYAIASQAVFTRFVKLPTIGEEQVEQIVGFEAQQNVPYPINEVVWDYQLVDSGDASQVEVVIVAIKSDLLDEINDGVESSGMRTATVDVAPMALYNAFRYNYSDLAGCSLIIDIGARTTNLVFVEPKKVFSRNITSGGNTITAAIAKEFNEPFGASEERKKRDGFVSLGGAYADPDDPDVARVSKIVRNSMTRLHAEIARSISFYRSQQGGGQPVRVFLAGGSASLPYMREFFHEKFQLPVEFFNPLRNVAVGSSLDIDDIGKRAHAMGELVGLALRSLHSCPMEFNLRPAGVVRAHRLAEQRPAFILAGVCLMLALTAFWFYYDRAATVTNEVVERFQPKLSELKSYDARMNSAKSAIKAEQDSAQPLLAVVPERDYWVRVINDVNSRLPKDFVWVTGFEPRVVMRAEKAAASPAGKPAPKPAKGVPPPQKEATIVDLRGLYLYNERGPQVVDDFINKLAESELYELNKDELKRSVMNEAEWAYEWSVPLILKNPIAIPAPKKP